MMPQQPIEQGIISDLQQDDNSRWEIDTAPIIDSFYHELLGETDNGEGVWVRDDTLKRFMNEKGASWVKSLMKSRINKITMLSKLNKEFISTSLIDLSFNVADVLFSNYSDWEIDAKYSNLVSISDMIVEKIYITYLASNEGGIREYRIRSKGGGNNLMMPQQMGMGYPSNIAAMMENNNGVM